MFALGTPDVIADIQDNVCDSTRFRTVPDAAAAQIDLGRESDTGTV